MSRQLSLNLGLDVVPHSKDQDTLVDMYRVYNATKLIASALDLYTGILGEQQEDWASVGTTGILTQNGARIYVEFAASATPGQLIALDTSGKAILGTIGTVIGWSPAAVVAGNFGEVRLLGRHAAVTGLTPGVSYYASSTPGGITGTVTAQRVGFALTANSLFFNPAQKVEGV